MIQDLLMCFENNVALATDSVHFRHTFVHLSKCHEWSAASISACLRRGPRGCFWTDCCWNKWIAFSLDVSPWRPTTTYFQLFPIYVHYWRQTLQIYFLGQLTYYHLLSNGWSPQALFLSFSFCLVFRRTPWQLQWFELQGDWGKWSENSMSSKQR